jgi:transcriptional regulator with XRE-family HTH domain
VISIRNKDYIFAFGENLKRLRTEKGLSQGKLSINADLPLNQIGRIELAEVNTTISTILALSIALEVEPNVLLSFPYNPTA